MPFLPMSCCCSLLTSTFLKNKNKNHQKESRSPAVPIIYWIPEIENIFLTDRHSWHLRWKMTRKYREVENKVCVCYSLSDLVNVLINGIQSEHNNKSQVKWPDFFPLLLRGELSFWKVNKFLLFSKYVVSEMSWEFSIQLQWKDTSCHRGQNMIRSYIFTWQELAIYSDKILANEDSFRSSTAVVKIWHVVEGCCADAWQ